MDYLDYIQRLAKRYNHPSRPQLPFVVKAIAGMVNPRDAWEHLLRQGLLPNPFANNQRRRYGDHHPGQPISPFARPPEQPQPSSVEAVLTIAADPSGILDAEAYAQELTRRLKPWTAVCNNSIVWYISDNPFKTHPYEVVYLGLAFMSALDTVNWSLDYLGIELEPMQGRDEYPAIPVLVYETVEAWKGWELAVRCDLEIVQPRWPLDLSKWRRFSELKNPFQPLLDLWCTGYRLVCTLDEKDPTIRLYAKPVRVDPD